MIAKKKQKDIIKDTIQELENEKAGVILDDEFEPEFISKRIIPGFRKSSDEIAVDELLAGLSNKAGWYLKLSKEVAANEYQFKTKITDFEAWADLELEIVNIVRTNTKRDPRRWGSGRYMIVAWNENGMRDKKPPRYIEVDAEEPVDINGNGNGNIGSTNNMSISPTEQFSAIAELLKTVNSLNPTTSPSDHLQLLSQSYLKGMETAGNKETSGNQMSMMMMTMMIGMMKEMMTSFRNPNVPIGPSSNDTVKDMLNMMNQFGIIGPNKEKGPDLLDTISKFREAGLISPPQTTDPIDQIQKMKQLVSIFSDLQGSSNGERPGILEKLIDALGPAIPGMISNISNTVDKVAALKKQSLQNPQPSQQPKVINASESINIQHSVQPEPVVIQSKPTSSSEQTEPALSEEEMILQLSKFAHELYDAVIKNDTTKYDYISASLKTYFGDMVSNGIKNGTISSETLIGYIKQFDIIHYRNDIELDKLIKYVNGYILSLRQTGHYYQVKCTKCGMISEFDNRDAFDESDKICGYEQGNVICDGVLA